MKKMPEGFTVGYKKTKIATVFDKEVFEEICRRAVKEQKTFSECANDIVKCGLLCLNEAGE